MGVREDLAGAGLADIARKIAAAEVSSEEVTRACLDRVEQWQPSRNCFIHVDAEAALERARECDRLRSAGRLAGPLHGVPMAHKDAFYRAGRISTGGSEIRRTWSASSTATVLARLDEAGAIQLGTLNMSEFAAFPTGHNLHYGDCRNAYDSSYMAGGSSSGSAVAVAARLAYAALGSDTGGSIRVPAAANGVLGLKPTYGRVSRHGVMARFWSLDHVGILARNAEDCALVLGVIAGFDPGDRTSSRVPVSDYTSLARVPVKGTRIGVPEDSMLGPLDDQVARGLESSIAALQALGATTVPVALGDLHPLFRIAELIGKCEAASMHREWLASRPGDYSPQVLSRTEAGFFIPAPVYLDALRLRKALLREFLDTTMAKVDVLHLPVMPGRVPTLEECDGGNSHDRAAAIRARMNAFTRPINLLGLPAISVPCGFDTAGLPLAFQLVGHPYGEARLLGIAHAFEQSTRFHRRVPAP